MKLDKEKILLIDFDDTTHNTKDRRPGHRMGQPQPGAVAAFTHLYNRGYHIVIFTGRQVDKPNVYKAVADWLDYFRFPYHEITNVKPDGYGFIIDNRAIHYETWESALVKLHHLETTQQEEQYTHEDLDKVDKAIW